MARNCCTKKNFIWPATVVQIKYMASNCCTIKLYGAQLMCKQIIWQATVVLKSHLWTSHKWSIQKYISICLKWFINGMSNCTVFIRNIFLKDMSVGYDITYKYINPKVNNLDNINPEYLFKERARAARVRKIFVLSIIYPSTRFVTKNFFS